MKLADSIIKWWKDDYNFLPRLYRDFRYKRVGLHTFTYNPVQDCYHDDYVHIPKKDLPQKAVHVTGGRWKEWFIDEVNTGKFPEPGHCTAIDLHLWMDNNDIDNALAFKHRKPLPVDGKLLVIAIIAIVVCGFLGLKGFMG